MAYTQASSVSSDTTAFEQLAYFALRSQPMFEMVADVKSTNQSHPGSAVQFNIYNDLAQATSALTETSDVTAVALGDSTVTVTLAEYGNAVTTTAKLRGTSFLNVDADAANIIGYNMANSIDRLFRMFLLAAATSPTAAMPPRPQPLRLRTPLRLRSSVRLLLRFVAIRLRRWTVAFTSASSTLTCRTTFVRTPLSPT